MLKLKKQKLRPMNVHNGIGRQDRTHSDVKNTPLFALLCSSPSFGMVCVRKSFSCLTERGTAQLPEPMPSTHPRYGTIADTAKSLASVSLDELPNLQWQLTKVPACD
jgi:hypothetical protein